MTLEKLREKMCIPANASIKDIEQTFNSIAEILKSECVIKYKNEEYRILDFEFYFFNMNHQDISVHPRESEALCWHINDFGGIDLNFESNIKKVHVVKNNKLSFKYELTDKSYYGGILIRQILRLSDKLLYDSPLKVAELFRTLDATSYNQNCPILEIKQIDTVEFKDPEERHNLLGSHKDAKTKADYNIQECFTNVSDSKKRKLEENLITFKNSKYRYCWKSK